MFDPESIVLSCSEPLEIVSVVNKLTRTLPSEMRKRFVKIFTTYLARYKEEGAHERMNGRTVSQIFAEFQPPEDLKVIATGEVEGMRYTLYDAPPPSLNNDEGVHDP